MRIVSRLFSVDFLCSLASIPPPNSVPKVCCPDAPIIPDSCLQVQKLKGLTEATPMIRPWSRPVPSVWPIKCSPLGLWVREARMERILEITSVKVGDKKKKNFSISAFSPKALCFCAIQSLPISLTVLLCTSISMYNYFLSKAFPWLLLTCVPHLNLLPFRIQAFAILLVPPYYMFRLLNMPTQPSSPCYVQNLKSTPLSFKILSTCEIFVFLPF